MDWRSVLNIVGLSSIIGIVLSWWLTSRREHRRWILDNQKQEWRELIDELHTCLDQMGHAFRMMRTDADNQAAADGARRGIRIIRNRIFIAETVEFQHLEQRWKDMIEYANHALGGRHHLATADGYSAMARELQEHLLLFARVDLGI